MSKCSVDVWFDFADGSQVKLKVKDVDPESAPEILAFIQSKKINEADK